MKVVLIGYGKMGKTLHTLLQKRNHEVVGIVDLENASDLEKIISKGDVAIEFSTPETAYSNISTCIKNKVPVVSGTTGWLEKYTEIEALVEGNKGSLFYASNYSVGVNIFFELNKYLAKLMNNFNEYDLLLEEVHHTEKKDSPSGTALTLANGILDNLDRKISWKENQICEGDDLAIYSKREGKVFGIHKIKYHNMIDNIEIAHEAYGREGFAHGAISAAEWLINKKGVFGMKDMLGIESD